MTWSKAMLSGCNFIKSFDNTKTIVSILCILVPQQNVYCDFILIDMLYNAVTTIFITLQLRNYIVA